MIAIPAGDLHRLRIVKMPTKAIQGCSVNMPACFAGMLSKFPFKKLVYLGTQNP